MGKSRRVGTFIPVNLLNNPLASCSLINLTIYCHKQHSLMKAFYFFFLSFQTLAVHYFFYTPNNKIGLFYK